MTIDLWYVELISNRIGYDPTTHKFHVVSKDRKEAVKQVELFKSATEFCYKTTPVKSWDLVELKCLAVGLMLPNRCDPSQLYQALDHISFEEFKALLAYRLKIVCEPAEFGATV